METLSQTVCTNITRVGNQPIIIAISSVLLQSNNFEAFSLTWEFRRKSKEVLLKTRLGLPESLLRRRGKDWTLMWDRKILLRVPWVRRTRLTRGLLSRLALLQFPKSLLPTNTAPWALRGLFPGSGARRRPKEARVSLSGPYPTTSLH